MTDRELLQMALNVLERYKSPDSTIKALRARLAQPEHPDAQGSPCPKFWDWLPKAYGQTESFSKYNMEVAYLEGKKAQSERAECDGGQCGIGGYCKQCPKTQPEPEPVAWISDNAGLYHGKPPESLNSLPLYLTPPQREWVGLTDEQYEVMAEQHVTNCYFDTLKYAKAIEAKLKDNNYDKR